MFSKKRETIGIEVLTDTLVFGNVMTRNSIKVEFKAVAQGISETLWIKKLLMESGFSKASCQIFLWQ